MTRAPANLLAVRTLLLTHLNVDPKTVRAADLEPAEVGVVGDTAHQKQGDSYHLGKPEQRSTGYSVSESPRDKAGLSELAAGLDIGDFAVTVAGKRHTLATFSAWCVAECKANAPDTRDIREIIYSPDGKTVKRWDRLGKRSSGDDSHRWHTHFSFFRDAIKAGRDQRPLFARYLTTIGLIEGDDDMSAEDSARLLRIEQALLGTGKGGYGFALKDANGKPGPVEPLAQRLADLTFALVAGPAGSGAYVAKWMTEVVTKAGVDGSEIVQGVLAGLTPEKIAAAIPPALTKQVADELARRMQG
ncbi:hypothetical protein [Micromonospora profundi]|uniref:hypothetical protein n=1 Tax=Micromonospora profundi TaxID=1420889 RepID=UPI003658E845